MISLFLPLIMPVPYFLKMYWGESIRFDGVPPRLFCCFQVIMIHRYNLTSNSLFYNNEMDGDVTGSRSIKVYWVCV